MRKAIILTFLLAASLANNCFAQLTYNDLYVDYDSARQFKNLKIIPIRPKKPGAPALPELSNTITLSQALANGSVTVRERGTASTDNVHWLSLYNNSGKNVFVSSGEILSGGRQDRMVTKDTLIMAGINRSDLHVMCVEEERWSKKDKPFTY